MDENADLRGTSSEQRIAVGSETEARIFHSFENDGPTAAAEATVSGTVTGATIDPSTFGFFSESRDFAADRCTVTTTTFTCAPVTSGGVFYAPNQSSPTT